MNISTLSISPSTTVKDALRKLDDGALRILFVVDEYKKLLGTLTDGDVRRHILRDGDIRKPVEACYNKKPTTVADGDDDVTKRSLMLERKVEVIPSVDEQGRLTGYVRWSELFSGKPAIEDSIDLPVVIMAGGKGTRLDPFTKILPKPLIPVGDKPIVEAIMDRFHEYGARDFYLTINYKGAMIKSYFESTETSYNVNYVCEDEFMGTAGSLRFLPEEFPRTFILSNCDVVVEADYADLVNFHKKKGYSLSIVGSIQHYRIPYGILEYEEGGALREITEKPEYDFIINTGLYVLESETLKYIPEGKVFDMTDLITLLMKKGKKVGVYPVSEKSYIDIGQWEEYKNNLDRFIID